MSLRIKLYNSLRINYDSNYGYYAGSLNLWNQILWNFIFPGRLFHRIVGNTIFRKKYNKFYYNKNDTIDFKNIFTTFNNDGAVILNNYFSEQEIENLKKIYSEEIKELKKIEEKKSESITLPLKKDLIKFWLDENLIGLLKNMSSSNILARNYPLMTYHTNFDDQLSSKDKFLKNYRSKFADDWHVDHANLFNLHVLLEDINENDMCMEYIPGSHKKLNQTYLYSDEEIRKLKTKIKKCYGKKGTIYIHYGNTIHRMKTVHKTTRLQLHFEFTSKTNILINSNLIAKCLSSNFDLNNLNKFETEICAGLFPPIAKKGYSLINNKYFPSNPNIT